MTFYVSTEIIDLAAKVRVNVDPNLDRIYVENGELTARVEVITQKGETLAIMSGPVMRFNRMACVERMIDVAEAMGEHVHALGKLDAAHRAAEVVQQFAKSIGLLTYLTKDVHDPAAIPHMAKIAISNDNTYGNPRIPTQDDIEALFQQAYKN